MKKIILTLAILTLFAPFVFADNGVECELKYYQFDQTSQKDILLHTDTALFVTNFKSNGFMGPFSFEIETTAIDSTGIEFNLHIVTVGLAIYSTSKKYIVEYGLPATLDNIEGKNGTRYKFVLTPLTSRVVEDSECLYNQQEKDQFTFSPTAHTDIYYVKGSLGEFYWDVVKG